MTSGASRKILAIFLLIGFIFPQFSAFALLGDITNIGECALKNKLKAFLRDVLNEVVKVIKSLIKAAACAAISIITGGLVNCPDEVITKGATEQDIAKETIEDVIARCVARQALTRITNGMLSIVREKGRDGGPVYVQDWRNFTLQGQQRGENIWRGLLYIAANGDSNIPPLLCKHILESQAFKSLLPRQVSNLIQSGLNRRIDSLQEYLVATKCDPIVNQKYDIFIKNFSAGGGWDTFERLLQPQNNIYGSIELANQELVKQRAIEEKTNINEAIAGSGFTGKRGESASDSCLSFDISSRCVVYKNIQTPGFILAESTNKALNSELDWIVSSDEIHELLTDMFFVMISRLSNLGGSEPTKPPIELNPEPNEIFQSNDPEDLCAESCVQTYPPGPELNACVAVCYGQEPPAPPGGGGGSGVCRDQGGTADYAGALQSAIDAVIAANPGGIADTLNTAANGFTILDLVSTELQSAGFNATTDVKNGNDNPNQGDLIAVWRSGDTTIERYDAIRDSGAGTEPLRDKMGTDYTGDIPLSCAP